jgi:amidohydrolase
VLENPAPLSVIAQHVFPSLAAGKVGFAVGPYMAACDEIYLTVKGKGGHAALSGQSSVVSARPDESFGRGQTIISPLLITSEILLELDKVFMHKLTTDNWRLTTSSVVLAFGKMNANGATNIIPNEVKLEGTFRTMDESGRADAHKLMREIVAAVAKKWGGDFELIIDKGYPVLINNDKVTNRARTAAEEFLGKENVVTLEPRMTSEDFAYYSLLKPSCFYRLGTANAAKGITSGLHTPTFNVEESAIETATGLMAWLAINELK